MVLCCFLEDGLSWGGRERERERQLDATVDHLKQRFPPPDFSVTLEMPHSDRFLLEQASHEYTRTLGECNFLPYIDHEYWYK